MRSFLLLVAIAACYSDGDELAETRAPLSEVGPSDVIPISGMTPGPIEAAHGVGHGGQLQYTIPLWVVPGRLGMEPKLAIVYTGGPTTHLGRGFALAGESAISRCQRTFVRDGVPAAIAFDDRDAFCLDGARLVLISGKNGQPGAEYRPEIEDNSKIVIESADALGPVEWTVHHPSGIVDRYGTKHPHRLEGPRAVGRRQSGVIAPMRVPSGDARLRWLRASSADRMGNGIRYEYSLPDGQITERVLSRISYTTQTQSGAPAANRSVELHYDIRLEPAHAFVSGMRIDQTRQLRRIEIKGPASAGVGPLYRAYDLNYRKGMTGEPLLSTFRECDGAGICKRPLVFGWTTGSSALDAPFLDYNTHLTPFAEPQQGVGYGYLERIRSGDFDGDGRDDLLVLDENRVWNLLRSSFGPHGTDAFRTPVGVWGERTFVNGNSTSLLYEHMLRFADLNFDNRLDMLSADLPANPPYFPFLAEYKNCVSGPSLVFSCPFTEPTLSTNLSSNAYLGDFDGNGRLDLIRQVGALQTGLGYSSVALNIDAGAAYAYSPVLDIAGKTFDTMPGATGYVLDLDGDRRFEMVDLEVAAGATTGWLDAFAIDAAGVGSRRTMNLPSKFELAKSDSCAHPIFGDVNGDGLVDAVVPGCSHDPKVFLNSGDGFLPSFTSTPQPPAFVPPARYGTASADDGIRLIDVNRDGREDLLFTYALAPAMKVLIARPDGNFRSRSLKARDPNTGAVYDLRPGDHGLTGPFINQVLDVNGDGAQDFIQFLDGELHVYVADPRPADLLESVHQYEAEDELRVTYTPGLDHSVVALMSPPTATFPQIESTGRGLWVVSRVARSNGAGGSSLAQAHAYRRPIADVHYGFVGFADHTLTDLTSTTTFQFDLSRASTGRVHYAARGLPVRTTTEAIFDSSGERLHTNVSATYSVVPAHSAAGTVRVRTDAVTTALSQSSNGTGFTPLKQSTRTQSQYDWYGNPRRIVTETIEPGAKHVVENDLQYDNYDAGNEWILSRTTSVTTTATDAQGRSQVRTTTSAYDPTTGALTSRTIEPNDPALYLETRYTLDPFGNLEAVEHVDADGTSRRAYVGYDADFIHPTSYTNALSHTERAVVHPGFGVATSTTDHNGAVTRRQLDGFGRTKVVELPGGEVMTTVLSDGAAFAAQGVVDSVQQRWASKSGTVTSYYDGFGRLVIEDSTDHRGQISRVTYAYDAAKGWLDERVGPMTPGATTGAPRLTYARDLIGRPLEIDDSGSITRHTYSGLSRTTTDPAGKISKVQLGAIGVREIQRLDRAKAVVTSIEHGPFGAPVRVTQTARNGTQQVSTYAYDVLGRMTAMTDEAGVTQEYTYTPFGEVSLVTDTDTSGQILLETEATFDDLGRMLTLTDLTNNTFSNTYVYDTAVHGVGQLARASTADGVVSEFTYDGLGRATGESTSYDGETYTFSYGYDGFGRTEETRYPQPPGPFAGLVTTKHAYHPITGVAERLESGIVAGGVVWSLQDVDSQGRPTRVELGNKLVERRDFDRLGRLRTARTETPGGNRVRELGYDYYPNGNMRWRRDVATGLREQFTHDFLDRLIAVDVFYGDLLLQHQATVYDDFGNFETRARGSEVLSYRYNTGVAPHGQNAVTELHSPLRDLTYEYDARGNQVLATGTELVNGVRVQAPSRRVQYTGFDLPQYIDALEIVNGKRVRTSEHYLYDAFHRRFAKRELTTGDLVIERGTAFRRVRTATTDTWETTFEGPFGPSASVATPAYGNPVVTYLHTGAQSSLDTVTDTTGAIVSRRAYMPFGEVAGTPLALGFTGQRHDAQALINLNGRIYDALSARFLTKDPRNSRPLDSQAYNRYAYVLNAPLALTDITGYQVDQDWVYAPGPSRTMLPLGDGLDPIPIINAAHAPSAIVPCASNANVAPPPAEVDDDTSGGTPPPAEEATYYAYRDEETSSKLRTPVSDAAVPPPADIAWHNVPDGNGVEPIPNGQSIPIDASKFAGAFDVSIYSEPALGSWQLREFVRFQQNYNRPDASYDEYQAHRRNNGVAGPGIAPWEIFWPAPRVAAPVVPLAQITRNRITGNAFRNAFARQFSMIGLEVEKEVTFRTVLGIRYADIVVSYNGVRLFTIETKLGSSVYYSMQQAKDALIWFEHGLPTFLKRSGVAPEINPGGALRRFSGGP